MSKRFSATTAVAIFLMFVTLPLLVAQRADRKPMTSAEAASALSATAEVLDQVSQLRGLPVKYPVKSGFKSRAEVERMIIADLNDSRTSDEIAASQKIWIKLGMLPPDFVLRDYMVKLYTEQIAGFYEPRSKEFYLADWIPISDQRMVMAHELTHALQDQYFDLKRFNKFPKHQSDGELAVHSLIEGEATVMMLSWRAQREASQLPLLDIPSDKTASGEHYPVFENAPLILRENVVFPYFYGAAFVQTVLRAGSWESITRGYSDPPISTEQIMHPEKYLNRDNPIAVKLPNLTQALGPEWRKLDDDVMGEFNYKLMLEQFIDKHKAEEAAAGWGGDRYVAFENQRTSEILVAQLTVWDSETDAKEFFEAYAERTALRYDKLTSTNKTSDERQWTTPAGDVTLRRKGDSVLIIEGSELKQHKSIATALWRSEHKRISSIQ